MNRRQRHAEFVDEILDDTSVPFILAARIFETTGHNRITAEAMLDIATTLARDTDVRILLNGLVKTISEKDQ